MATEIHPAGDIRYQLKANRSSGKVFRESKSGQSLLSAHEDAAMISLVLTLILGVYALTVLCFQRNSARARILNLSVMVAASLVGISLAYTASLGGQIRHTELRSQSVLE